MSSGRLSSSRPDAWPPSRTGTTPGAAGRVRTSAARGAGEARGGGRAGAPTGPAWTVSPFSTAETLPSSVRTTRPVSSIASTGSSASTATSTSKSLASVGAGGPGGGAGAGRAGAADVCAGRSWRRASMSLRASNGFSK